MQIEKINENKLEITITIEDLNQKNIDIKSFLSEYIENQSLFLEILNFANKKTGFNLNNCELIVEEFLIPSKNSFIIIITRIPSKIIFHVSKTKYKRFKINKSFWLRFTKFETLCAFTNFISKNLKAFTSLYILNNNYYMLFNFTHFRDLIKIKLIGSEFADTIFNNKYFLDENSKIIIKKNALQTCQKYFIL